MACSEGLEPPTSGLEVQYSVQLSYEQIIGTQGGTRTHKTRILSAIRIPDSVTWAFGTGTGARTQDSQIKSLLLYQLSYTRIGTPTWTRTTVPRLIKAVL